jgi:hypothetical protein
MSAGEYLTVNEVAGRLKVHPKTVRNKMALGIFKLVRERKGKKGVYYRNLAGSESGRKRV